MNEDPIRTLDAHDTKGGGRLVYTERTQPGRQQPRALAQTERSARAAALRWAVLCCGALPGLT
jgi:hypothetical protein